VSTTAHIARTVARELLEDPVVLIRVGDRLRKTLSGWTVEHGAHVRRNAVGHLIACVFRSGDEYAVDYRPQLAEPIPRFAFLPTALAEVDARLTVAGFTLTKVVP
jgi:hypothetical protein